MANTGSKAWGRGRKVKAPGPDCPADLGMGWGTAPVWPRLALTRRKLGWTGVPLRNCRDGQAGVRRVSRLWGGACGSLLQRGAELVAQEAAVWRGEVLRGLGELWAVP